MTGEVQDILNKVKKYGNLRVHSLRYLIPQTEADELLSEIEADVTQLAHKTVFLGYKGEDAEVAAIHREEELANFPDEEGDV